MKVALRLPSRLRWPVSVLLRLSCSLPSFIEPNVANFVFSDLYSALSIDVLRKVKRRDFMALKTHRAQTWREVLT